MKGKLSETNALKRGVRDAFAKFDGYQLAKYRGERSAVKLVDVVNLVHPAPTDLNRVALNQLVAGKLRSTDTDSFLVPHDKIRSWRHTLKNEDEGGDYMTVSLTVGNFDAK